jgi:hypothetical protein
VANKAPPTKASFELPIEKRTLASYLGMAPAHLSHAFAQLGEHGVEIEVSGQRVTNKRVCSGSRGASPSTTLAFAALCRPGWWLSSL